MLEELFFVDKGRPACPIYLLTKTDLPGWLEQHAGRQANWVNQSGFAAGSGTVLTIPDKTGNIESVLVGQGNETDFWTLGSLTRKLPEGVYRLAETPGDEDMALAALAWGLGQYSFERYLTKAEDRSLPSLVIPKNLSLDDLVARIEGLSLARDLINTPANDMGPQALHEAMETLAGRHLAGFKAIVGDDLLDQNFPLVHAVGRASDQAPRVLELVWGDEAYPMLTLVGKGVCFDSGGLNIKPGTAMDLMKKDMGGAACVLGLAHIIMSCNLPVRLRVLVGAVENAISAGAFRPGDVLSSRKGTTVEIGNTDAEGRLVLADLLTLADEDAPDLLIDMATLTGAARVALGPEIAPFYTHNDELASALEAASSTVKDPVWRMPLWQGYDGWLSSKVADMNNISSGPFAGSITAALFLARFVETENWMHCDVYGWNAKPRPARPVGGEATAVRALFKMIEARYAR
ncbi:MAG: leucyl aminopeptidase family protein [Parvibaculales bacterium]